MDRLIASLSGSVPPAASLGFNGERLEPRIGQYLLGLGYRAYNPVLLRFNAPDSKSPFERGGLNAYGYGLGDPVNVIDPDGHVPLSALLLYASKRSGYPIRKLAPMPKGGVFTPPYHEHYVNGKRVSRSDSLSSLDELAALAQPSKAARKSKAPDPGYDKSVEEPKLPDEPPVTMLYPTDKTPFLTGLDGTRFYQAGLVLHPPKGPGRGERLRNFAVRKVNRVLGIRDTSR
ncbi:RHS repeat-associated core domain-containing protein [Pseudomonas putida CSV86]|uniref:RHS repeat-associated core domain-containing protein n=1 Tax=Pseudomonas bharatica CSV86 TaxID=1005395 RepID=L1M5M4_9PSED|nr:RHS repeat-associated core domain-containing protein [Pseudomonas bharatica CSV86]